MKNNGQVDLLSLVTTGILVVQTILMVIDLVFRH